MAGEVCDSCGDPVTDDDRLDVAPGLAVHRSGMCADELLLDADEVYAMQRE